jgi:hypothetical protein
MQEENAGQPTNHEELMAFLEENVKIKPANMRKLTPLGAGICISKDKLGKLIDLLGPVSIREDLIAKPAGGSNCVLPATVERFDAAVAVATTKRNKIRNHFKSRSRAVSREFRSTWYSNLIHHTQALYEKLRPLMLERPDDDELMRQGLIFPEQFELLHAIFDGLQPLLRVKSKLRAIGEIFASGKQLTYAYIPAPQTDGIYHFINQLLADLPPIEPDALVVTANQMMNHMLDELGATYLDTTTHRAVLGVHQIIDGKIHFQFNARNIICVSTSPTKIKSSNQFSLKLLRNTIQAIMVKKFKLNPDSINFNNIDRLKSTKREAYEWLIDLYIKIHKTPSLLNRLVTDEKIDNELTIIRSQSDKPPTEVKTSLKEKMIKEDLLKGKITNKPLPNNLPPAIKFVGNNLSAEFYEPLEEIWEERFDKCNRETEDEKHNEPNADASFKSPDSPKKVNPNPNNPISPKSIPAVINPSATEISEMRTLCAELNQLNKSNLMNIKCLNSNPGLCSNSGEKFKEIIQHVKNVDIIMANELRQERSYYSNSACWPDGFCCFSHDKIGSSDLSYSAILTRNSTLEDYIKESCSFGTITGLLLENDQKQKLCVFSIYRPIPKDDNDRCFYAVEGRNDPFVFVEWLKSARNYARRNNAGVIMAGDFNTSFDREGDDDKLSIAILDTLKDLVDLCVEPTFFKKNCNPSTIDHVFVSNPKNTNLKNLRLHKTLGHDGHCGQTFKFNFGVPQCSYKVTLSRKLDNPEMIKNKSLKLFSKVMRSIDSSKTPEERVQTAFTWSKKLLLKCSKQVVKIVADKSEFSVKKGRDTIEYEEMKKCVNKLRKLLDPPVGHPIHLLLSKLGVIIKKLNLRDKREARVKLSGKCEANRNLVWDIFN